jgi:hypothetical protein
MRIMPAVLIAAVSVTSGCATYYDAFAYQPSQTGPKAMLNVANRNEKGIVAVFVFPDCTRKQQPLSGPIEKGGTASKPIDAERPFTFSIGGDAGASSTHYRGCVINASFVPREGKTYDLVYYGDGNKCNIGVTEQTEKGARVPIAVQQKSRKMGVTDGPCD